MTHASPSLILAQSKRKLVATDDANRIGVEVNDVLIGHIVRSADGRWEPIRLDGARISPSRTFTDRKESAKALAYNHCTLNLTESTS